MTLSMADELLDALDASAPLSERGLSKLRWRCRRGLLENDQPQNRPCPDHPARHPRHADPFPLSLRGLCPAAAFLCMGTPLHP